MKFFAECNEPKVGRVVREVRDLDRSFDHLLERHLQLLSVPSFLATEDGIGGLTSLFEPGVHLIEVGNCGMIGMDRVVCGVSAQVHCTFWDKRLRGREKLCGYVCRRWMEEYELQYVWAQTDGSMLHRFLERVGFVEGLDHTFYLHRVNRPTGGLSLWDQ